MKMTILVNIETTNEIYTKWSQTIKQDIANFIKKLKLRGSPLV
jgi:hypothetical protein